MGGAGGCTVILPADGRLVSCGDDTLDGLVTGGEAGAKSGGGGKVGKSFLRNEALSMLLSEAVEGLSVGPLDSSAISCSGGRGWTDVEGGASMDDCDRRLNPAYIQICNTLLFHSITHLVSLRGLRWGSWSHGDWRGWLVWPSRNNFTVKKY